MAGARLPFCYEFPKVKRSEDGIISINGDNNKARHDRPPTQLRIIFRRKRLLPGSTNASYHCTFHALVGTSHRRRSSSYTSSPSRRPSPKCQRLDADHGDAGTSSVPSTSTSTFALEGRPDAMIQSDIECIGTGTDVECVVLSTDPDEPLGKKIASRAIGLSRNNLADQELRSEMQALERSPLMMEKAASNPAGSEERIKKFGEFLLLISPFFFWGTAMVAMKGVLLKAGPLFVAATRLIPSGLLVIAFATYKGRKQPSGFYAWMAIILFALVDATCFQGFLAEGLKRTSAGLGSVIIDSQPLTVAVLASFLFGETIGLLGILGLATGVIGLLLLEVPVQVLEDFLKGHTLTHISDSMMLPALDQKSNWSIWDSGEWWMLLAAQSMAIGTVMVRWLCQFADPIMATGWHMVIGGIPLLALASINQDPALAGPFHNLQSGDWFALSYASIFGSAISYGVFFYNASKGSLTRLSSLTFMTPMFAALFGYLLLDETLTPVQIMGAMVTLGSIYLINAETGKGKQEDG